MTSTHRPPDPSPPARSARAAERQKSLPAEEQAVRSRRGGWRFWAFIGFMLALMGLFIGLGAWQMERLGEKERLIANVTARFHQPPVAFPPVAEWGAFDSDAFDYRPVKLAGQFLPEHTVLVFTSLGDAKGQYSGPGYWVMTPLALTGGGTVFVNRGFVPQGSATAFVNGGTVQPGIVEVTGVARQSEAAGSFTPEPDAAGHIDWIRNVRRMTALAGRLPEPVAPVYVDTPASQPGALPQGGETVVDFPNNHLGYVVTWFGFALLVPFLLFFWVRRQGVRR